MVESTDRDIHPATSPAGEVPAEHGVAQHSARPDAETLVEADLLVEDVSIDGMCGVY